jgi:hypothetical protein
MAYRKGVMGNAEFNFTEHGLGTHSASDLMKDADHYIISIARAVLDGFEATQHQVTNIVHRLDGDTVSYTSWPARPQLDASIRSDLLRAVQSKQWFLERSTTSGRRWGELYYRAGRVRTDCNVRNG